jgi:hypothetical protein
LVRQLDLREGPPRSILSLSEIPHVLYLPRIAAAVVIDVDTGYAGSHKLLRGHGQVLPHILETLSVVLLK